jgi:hypothetical protein
MLPEYCPRRQDGTCELMVNDNGKIVPYKDYVKKDQ